MENNNIFILTKNNKNKQIYKKKYYLSKKKINRKKISKKKYGGAQSSININSENRFSLQLVRLLQNKFFCNTQEHTFTSSKNSIQHKRHTIISNLCKNQKILNDTSINEIIDIKHTHNKYYKQISSIVNDKIITNDNFKELFKHILINQIIFSFNKLIKKINIEIEKLKKKYSPEESSNNIETTQNIILLVGNDSQELESANKINITNLENINKLFIKTKTFFDTLSPTTREEQTEEVTEEKVTTINSNYELLKTTIEKEIKSFTPSGGAIVNVDSINTEDCRTDKINTLESNIYELEQLLGSLDKNLNTNFTKLIEDIDTINNKLKLQTQIEQNIQELTHLHKSYNTEIVHINTETINEIEILNKKIQKEKFEMNNILLLIDELISYLNILDDDKGDIKKEISLITDLQQKLKEIDEKGFINIDLLIKDISQLQNTLSTKKVDEINSVVKSIKEIQTKINTEIITTAKNITNKSSITTTLMNLSSGFLKLGSTLFNTLSFKSVTPVVNAEVKTPENIILNIFDLNYYFSTISLFNNDYNSIFSTNNTNKKEYKLLLIEIILNLYEKNLLLYDIKDS